MAFAPAPFSAVVQVFNKAVIFDSVLAAGNSLRIARRQAELEPTAGQGPPDLADP
jgi:hypothetical protein